MRYVRMSIKNYMEDCVSFTLDDTLGLFDCCKCEECRNDIMAMALNSLPPKYVATTKGTLFTKINMTDRQLTVDVTTAVINAITKISSNPKHAQNT